MSDADSTDWTAIRARFPILANKTYLNSCAYGALSTDVTAAFQAYLDDRLVKGTDWQFWVERNESVRTAVAKFLGAKARFARRTEFHVVLERLSESKRREKG